jgi:AcrR family transcriptional regulator
MAISQRREREKAAFRELVLDAARKIILKEGFQGLTMRKIAEAIEYAPGTIYLYFKNRDEVAAELTQRGFEEFLRALGPAADIPDPAKRLERLGTLYVKFAYDDPETYRLIFMENYTADVFEQKGQDDPGQQALQLLVDIFDQLRAQKRLAVDAPSAALADVAWTAMHGIASLKLNCQDRYPQTATDELVRTSLRVLTGGLVTRPA